MDVDREIAMKIWRKAFGDVEYAWDCYGTRMFRDGYSKEPVYKVCPDGDGKRYDYSWNIDHICPKSNFDNESDADTEGNYEPIHRLNNSAKSDHLKYIIGGKEYKVVKHPSKHGYYEIQNSKGDLIGWKSRKGYW